MNLYKISQHVDHNWETYDSAVVAAKSEEEARKIIPAHWMRGWLPDEDDRDSWVESKDVNVELVGVVDDNYLDKLNGRTTVVSSYNAG